MPPQMLFFARRLLGVTSCLYVFLFLSLSITFAQDESATTQWRTWSDISGRFQVEGRLIGRQGNCIRLEMRDGRNVEVAIQHLSAGDQNYLQQSTSPPAQPENQSKPDDTDIGSSYDADAMRSARRELIVDLSRGKSNDRANAARQLADHPDPDTVDALIGHGFKSDEPEVQAASLETLLRFRENIECVGAILKAMQKHCRAKDGAKVIVPGLAILLSSKSDTVKESGVKYLTTRLNNAQLAQVCFLLFQMLELKLPTDQEDMGPAQGMLPWNPLMPGMGMPQGAAGQQGGWNPLAPGAGQATVPQAEPVQEKPNVAKYFDEESKARILHAMTKTSPYLQSFPFRRAVARALTSLNTKSAVPIAIDALFRTRGETRGDIVSFLTSITDQHFGLNAKAWQTWWEIHGANFTMPDRTDQQSLDPVADDTLASYYGLPLYAERIVFVLDTSGSMMSPTAGSMGDTRIEMAKRELIQAISNLSPDVGFSIVIYNSDTRAWQKNLVPATPSNKTQAANYVGKLSPGGGTMTGKALQDAFRFDIEAIYLLSDGYPSENPQQIIQQVAQANRQRMISIYTIGVGMDDQLGAGFLQQLSAQNFGQYVAR